MPRGLSLAERRLFEKCHQYLDLEGHFPGGGRAQSRRRAQSFSSADGGLAEPDSAQLAALFSHPRGHDALVLLNHLDSLVHEPPDIFVSDTAFRSLPVLCHVANSWLQFGRFCPLSALLSAPISLTVHVARRFLTK